MRFLTSVFFIIVFSMVTLAQSVQIEGIRNYRFSGVHPIVSNIDQNVNGYYTYYLLEREGKGMHTFEFSIVDKNVTKVLRTPITLHKRSEINATVFNGDYFLISYDDIKNKKTVFNLVDLKGKVIKTKEFEIEKRRLANSKVFPAAGDGFYLVKPEKPGRGTGYTIEKVDNQLNTLWKVDDIPEKGFRAVADMINSKKRLIIWQEFGPSGRKIRPKIICYDAGTGDKIYEREGYDGESTILFNDMRLDGEGNLFAGGSYVDGDKYSIINTDGVYILKLDPKGKEILYNKVDRKERIQPVLKATSKGDQIRLGSKDKVFVEDIILEGDNIIVISEMFRKNLNMTPTLIQTTRDLISGKYIGDINNSGRPATFEIMDFMIFKFDNVTGELKELKALEKEDYNKISCYFPYVNYGGMALARVMTQLGWFDYAFTTYDKSGTNRLMITKNNATPRKPEVLVYNMDDSFAQRKIDLKQEAKIDLDKGRVSYFHTMRHKPGSVVVAYYQKKLKTITINIENID